MINNLKQLGLSYYESKALETLFKESLSAKELSKKSKIPLGKIYSIIGLLERKGLVKQTESRPRTVYVENASTIISRLIEQKQKEQEQLISAIKRTAIESDILKGQTPKFFQIGTTIEENYNIQLRTFLETEKEVCQIHNINYKPSFNRGAR